MSIDGVLLPLVTPFVNDEVDYFSYKRMINNFINKGITGIIPLGTTGESPVVSDYEYEKILDKTMEYCDGRVPVYTGLGGNNTQKVVNQLKTAERYGVKGILSVSPYYNRPDQRGIYEHFRRISEATALDIILYNIPYRTGRNIELDTILRLSELDNIVAIKDACGDFGKSAELIQNRPEGFSVLTGEDAFFFSTLALGGNGGILASANLQTEDFVKIYSLMKENNHIEALEIWRKLVGFIPMLFAEPNPAPVKYCLYREGLIASPELRQPLLEITDGLKEKLDRELFFEITKSA